MLGNEEIVVRMMANGSSWYFFTRPAGSTSGPSGSSASQEPGLQGGVNPTVYTTAATLGTAVANALPTINTGGPAGS